AVIGTNATFAGNILALTSISLNTGASLICGRALAQNGAVTLQQNTITVCVTNDEGGGDTGDIPIDELGGEGVTGTEQTAFDASRLFGSTMLAFPYLAVGAAGPGNNGPQGNGPEKYTPLKLGPSNSEPDLVVGP